MDNSKRVRILKQNIEENIIKLKLTNSCEEISLLYYYLKDLITCYTNISGNKFYLKYICSDKDILKKVSSLLSENYEKLDNNFIQNKDFYATIAEEIWMHKEVSLDDNFYYRDRRSLSGTISNKIILNYFRSEYESLLNEVLDIYKNRKIYRLKTNPYPSSAALVNTNYFDKTNTIFINYKYNVTSMISLVHELGHVIEENYNMKSCSLKQIYNMQTKGVFNEINSSFFEYDFCKTLISNNMFLNQAKAYLNNFYISMFDDLNSLLMLSILPNKLLKNEKYHYLTKKKFYSELLKTKLFFDKIDDISCPKCYNMDTHIRYGFGKVMALYLENLKESDTEEFNEVRRKINLLNQSYFKSDFFENLGIDLKSIAVGINSEIENGTKILKKRK